MRPPHRIAGLVLAAGGARRFGAAKQLAPLDGRPLLEHALAAMAAVPSLTRVGVTLGSHADEIVATVDLHGAQPILVEEWREGLAASLRRGVAALASEADAIVVVLGDQPLLEPAALERFVRAWDGREAALRASVRGVPGHPVLLARALYPDLAMLRGDAGAGRLLAALGAREVPYDASAAVDVDTPAALEALRRRRGG